ncbi:MAG: hypothetical protein JST16_05850 [Bdellovibrionales bacterium]|nr:hypothetical protein [Bdellovibrionales bacterium]
MNFKNKIIATFGALSLSGMTPALAASFAPPGPDSPTRAATLIRFDAEHPSLKNVDKGSLLIADHAQVPAMRLELEDTSMSESSSGRLHRTLDLPIVSDQLDSCNVRVILAERDLRAVDGTKMEIRVRDFTQATCEVYARDNVQVEYVTTESVANSADQQQSSYFGANEISEIFY